MSDARNDPAQALPQGLLDPVGVWNGVDWDNGLGHGHPADLGVVITQAGEIEAIICPAWSGATNLHSNEGRVAFTSEKVASVLTQTRWKQAGIRVRNISPDTVLCSCSVVRVVMWRDRAIPASRTLFQQSSWSGIDRFAPWLMACWYFAVQLARAWEAPRNEGTVPLCRRVQGGGY